VRRCFFPYRRKDVIGCWYNNLRDAVHQKDETVFLGHFQLFKLKLSFNLNSVSRGTPLNLYFSWAPLRPRYSINRAIQY